MKIVNCFLNEIINQNGFFIDALKEVTYMNHKFPYNSVAMFCSSLLL